MKQLFLPDDTVVNKVSYYHLALFLIALPVDFFYSQLILVSFAIHSFIHARKENYKNILSRPVLIIASLFLLNALAIAYSSDKPEGINVTTRQLAMLLFPVLFAINGLSLEKYRTRLFLVFGFTCVGTVLYLYAEAVRTILFFGLKGSALFSSPFMNHNFSLPIGIHATYLSLYVAFSLILFLYFIITKKRNTATLLYVFCSLVLLAGLIQLSSRAVFIALLLVINLGFTFYLFSGSKKWLFFLSSFLLSAATVVLIWNVDSFKTRYVSELKTDLTNNATLVENFEPRLARWDAIGEIVKTSPLIGHGTGAEKKLLKEKYYEKGFYISYLNEFNTHNEYLSILVKTGLMGLLLFLYVLYSGFASAFRQKDLLFLSFMIIITVVSVSENILELNKGIFFYAFFFSCFLGKPSPSPAVTPRLMKPGNPVVLKSV